jgi:hypothetical protein
MQNEILQTLQEIAKILEQIEANTRPKTRAKTQNFQKPTEAEIEAFMLTLTKNKPINAKETASEFFNHYEANGWLIGKAKMKSVEAAVRNWVKPKFWDQKSKPTNTPFKPNIADFR